MRTNTRCPLTTTFILLFFIYRIPRNCSLGTIRFLPFEKIKILFLWCLGQNYSFILFSICAFYQERFRKLCEVQRLLDPWVLSCLICPHLRSGAGESLVLDKPRLIVKSCHKRLKNPPKGDTKKYQFTLEIFSSTENQLLISKAPVIYLSVSWIVNHGLGCVLERLEEGEVRLKGQCADHISFNSSNLKSYSLYMCVCVWVCIYTYMYLYMCVYASIILYTYACAYVYIICACLYTNT